VRILTLLFLASSAAAQSGLLDNLSLSDDGKTLFFSTPLVPRGSSLINSLRVFRFASAGTEALTGGLSGNVDIYWVFSAGDPRTYAWSTTDCGALIAGSAAVTSPGGTQKFNRCVVGLSRNGRYAVLNGGWDSTAGAPLPPALLDLSTGQQSLAPQGYYRQAGVTSGGDLFLVRYLGTDQPDIELTLWNPRVQRFQARIPEPAAPAISDDGALIVYTLPIYAPALPQTVASTAVHVLETASGTDLTVATIDSVYLANVEPGSVTPVALSNTADVAWLQRGQDIRTSIRSSWCTPMAQACDRSLQPPLPYSPSPSRAMAVPYSYQPTMRRFHGSTSQAVTFRKCSPRHHWCRT
jgi:hypothetical protein